VADKRYSETSLEEVLNVLILAGVAQLNVTLFATQNAEIPVEVPESGYVHVIQTGGQPPQRTHNQVLVPAYTLPSFQVSAVAKEYLPAKALAHAAFAALVRVRNQEVVPIVV
jgi:hypothetical protein